MLMFSARQYRFPMLAMWLCAATLWAQSAAGQDQPAPPVTGSGLAACSEVPRDDALPFLCVPPSLPEGEELSAQLPAQVPVQVEVALNLPAGTPLRIVLDQRTRISHVDELVHGQVIEAVYAFDQVVIPAGSVATGRVARIEPVPAKRRVLSYTNGDFSPAHEYEVVFDTVTLPDGKQINIETTASLGAAEVVHLVSHPEEQEKKKNAAARAIDGAEQDAKDTVHQAVYQVRSPGRLERLKRFLVARLPYRRQYLEPGTHFNASLRAPLDFGMTMRTSEQLALLGTAPPPESLMHARLLLEVSSATATRGVPVVAVLTQPVYSPDRRLILPAESLLIGEVIQAQPARKLRRNGSLRVIFAHIETAGGKVQPVQGSLEGIEVDRAAHMNLDEEGGAHTTNSKTRYLSTGFAIAMAAVASRPDVERGAADPGGDPLVRAGAGGSGFGLAGGLISFAAKSTPLSIAFSVYGASSSVYANFLARGREVVFPKDTPLEIGFGAPHPSPQASQARR
jgi:hypothetical protein